MKNNLPLGVLPDFRRNPEMRRMVNLRHDNTKVFSTISEFDAYPGEKAVYMLGTYRHENLDISEYLDLNPFWYENKYNIIYDVTDGYTAFSIDDLVNLIRITRYDVSKIIILANVKPDVELTLTHFAHLDKEEKPTVIATNDTLGIAMREILNYLEKDKRFLYLSRNNNPARTMMFIELWRKGILDKSYFSFFHYNDIYIEGPLRSPLSFETFDETVRTQVADGIPEAQEVLEFWQQHGQDIYDNMPYTLPHETQEMGEYTGLQFLSKSAHQIYNSTFMSLIQETNTDSDQDRLGFPDMHHQLTEKTFKAIYFRHPFLLFGTRNQLKYIRDTGFKTYGDFFDESYDSVTNWKQRMHLIMKEMERLSHMPYRDFMMLMSQASEVADYNYMVLKDMMKNQGERGALLFGKHDYRKYLQPFSYYITNTDPWGNILDK